MGVKVKDKISRLKNRQSPADKVTVKLAEAKKLLDKEIADKAREALRGPKGDKGDKGDIGPIGPGGPKGEDGRTPVAGIDFVIHHGKDGRDGSNIDATGYVPYIGATGNVELGDYTLTSHGLFVNNMPVDAPIGPALNLMYWPDFLGDGIDISMIMSMDWDAGPQPMMIAASDILMDAWGMGPGEGYFSIDAYEIQIDCYTIELHGTVVGGIRGADGDISIASDDAYGKFVVSGDDRIGFLHRSADNWETADYSQFGLGVNVGGGLVTLTVDTPGTGYEVGDILEIYQPGTAAHGGIASVETIDGSGGVLTLLVYKLGTAYAIEDDLGTYALTGSGYDCIVNITEVTIAGYVFLESSSDGTGITQPIQIRVDDDPKLSIGIDGTLNLTYIAEHDDNAAALLAGLVTGDIYRTGDLLKIVH